MASLTGDLTPEPVLTGRGTTVAAMTDAGERRLHRQLWSDLRWAFRPPFNWVAGVAINLVLAVVWLFFEPLQGGGHRSWAVLIGTYFAVWVLADVTTTNVLGADALRVMARLDQRIPLRRILLVKNLTLLVIVGLPTLLATAAITLATQRSFAVVFTLLGVLFPVLTCLGVGNLVSVALPVAALPLHQRWRNRRDLRRTIRWLAALALPYLIYVLVSPVSALPRIIDSRTMLHIRGLPARSLTMAGTGLAFWLLGTVIALLIARRREVAFDDIPDVWREQPILVTIRKVHLDLATLLRLRRKRLARDRQDG